MCLCKRVGIEGKGKCIPPNKGKQPLPTGSCLLSIISLSKWSLLLKERICSQREQIVLELLPSDKGDKYFHIRTIFLEDVPLSHNTFLFSTEQKYHNGFHYAIF